MSETKINELNKLSLAKLSKLPKNIIIEYFSIKRIWFDRAVFNL